MSAAFVPGPQDDVSPEASVELGIAWAYNHDGPRCFLVPAMHNYLNSPLRSRVSRELVATLQSQSRSLLHRGGVAVLGCWPTANELVVLHRKATAGDPVCVLRWTNSVEERAWINSTRAVSLLTGQVGDDRHQVEIDPVVQIALRSLSIGVNLGSWNAFDEDRVKWVLQNAPKRGHRYEPDGVFEWVLVQQLYPWHQAMKLRELAAHVCKGKTFRLRNKQPFRADIWDRWRAEADAAASTQHDTNGGIASL